PMRRQLLFYQFIFAFYVMLQSASLGLHDEPVEGLLECDSISEMLASELSKQPLSKTQAEKITKTLVRTITTRLKEQRKEEWFSKRIDLDGRAMKFEFNTFGVEPDRGRRLFISMHGGGGAPARVNDRQWENQIRLYEPEEGIYLAPRAPTNTWNLWHQEHIDRLFQRVIEDAIVFGNVDPNRIHLMGYSAGGDGVYQLAPRMADQLAAAAMMAGHPNDAKPFGLRNIGFTIHMGGQDSAYDRNKKAVEWKEWLRELKDQDPNGYEHSVTIHNEHGHWMQRDDRVAVPWMSQFKRNPYPKKVVWYQSEVTHDRFYWLKVDSENCVPNSHVVAAIDGQKITISKAELIHSLTIRLNDQLVDLDREIVIQYDGQELFRGRLNRTAAVIGNSLHERYDPKMVFCAEVTIELSNSIQTDR
ncbi:MAG: dienelactone hydrolase family protein, partial [Planctomycetota bacterium]